MTIAPWVAALRRFGRFGGGVTPSGGGSPPVTFSATALRIRVELLLGGVWVDVSSLVLSRSSITIQRGRAKGRRKARISQCTLTFKNESKALSPRNVTGPYYGLLRQGTPLRVWANPGSGDSLRFTGRVPSWEPVIKSANDRQVTITAYGRRNALEIGDDVLESAQYRYLSTSGALQYRPMEGDGEGTTTGPPGSGDLPDLAQGGVWSDFPTAGPPESWRMEADAKFGLDKGTGDFAPIIRWNTGGTIGEWRLSADVLQAQLTYTVQATGAQTILDTGQDVYDGLWHHWQVDATQDGADIDVVIRMDGATVYSTTITTHTNGAVGFWLVQDDDPAAGAARMPAVGHVAVHGPVPSDTTSAYAAFTGWAGETPAERFARLCTENGIPYVVRELVPDGQLMGPQRRTQLWALLDECESTSEGVIDEDFGNNLRLSSRTAFWNQAVALALNYTATPSQIMPPLTPADDDDLTRNRWAISRDGSDDPAAVAELTSGPLNTSEPEDDYLGIGPARDSDTLSLYTADQALAHASYRVARDTVDAPRYPSVKVNLANAPTLISSWLTCDTGARVTIANPPADVGVDAPDTVMPGYGETFNQTSWELDLFLEPGAIHRQPLYGAAMVLDPATAARYDCRGSTLATALTAVGGAGTVDVAITDTCAWAHDTGDYDIMIGAEAITVTAVGAVSGTYPARTQTLTVTRAANGVTAAHAVGAEIHVRNRGRWAL